MLFRSVTGLADGGFNLFAHIIIRADQQLFGSKQHLNMAARNDRLVLNFLIGTMQVENFLTFFKRQKDVAVLCGGDRADLQLVALEGGCAALILTGNLYPNDMEALFEEFKRQAEAKGTKVHLAKDAAQACEIIAQIAKDNDVRTVVKSKSMVGTLSLSQ